MNSQCGPKKKYRKLFAGPVYTLHEEREDVVERVKKQPAPVDVEDLPRVCHDDKAVMLIFLEGAETVYRCPICKRIERSAQKTGVHNG